jgi:hypothetical protein
MLPAPHSSGTRPPSQPPTSMPTVTSGFRFTCPF